MAGKEQFVIQHKYGNTWKTDATMDNHEDAISEAESAKSKAESQGEKATFRVVRRSFNERFGTVQEDIVWGAGQGKENTASGSMTGASGGGGKGKKKGGMSSKKAMDLAKFLLIRVAIVAVLAFALLRGVPWALETWL